MKIGFLFPGQGSQAVGMGKDIYEKYDEAKKVYDRVKELTNVDIAKISFEGPEDVLNQTKYTQLAILTMSLAVVEILKKENIKAEISAGLSLGEYSALIYSGILDFDEGVKLVQKRGEYMQNLVPEGNWQMAAVLGLDDETVENTCKKVTNGFVVPANFNCNGQVVISGEEEAVKKAAELMSEAGARKVRVLKTSGPFHTTKLIEASKALSKELENTKFNKSNLKVVKNIDGTEYTENDNIKEILAKHIISPVRFSKSINTMLQENVDTFIEVGPGKTLSGFVKKAETTNPINILNINNVDTLENTIKFIKEETTNE